MIPCMLPGMEEVVYVGGRQQWLARGLYYVDCDCRNESVTKSENVYYQQNLGEMNVYFIDKNFDKMYIKITYSI